MAPFKLQQALHVRGDRGQGNRGFVLTTDSYVPSLSCCNPSAADIALCQQALNCGDLVTVRH